jgi:hypothetical protein
MDDAPDENRLAGTCPLCGAKVAAPRQAPFLDLLASHFETGCAAVALVPT